MCRPRLRSILFLIAAGLLGLVGGAPQPARADAAKLLDAIKGREQRGLLASRDPLTITASTYSYSFANRSDLERFAEGLRKAGVPE